MKKIYILFFFLFINGLAFAQLPNGGFESWDPINNFEKPSHWETNQDTFYTRITKDTIRIEGEFSLKLSSDVPSAWLDCNSKVSLTHHLNQPVGTFKSFFFNLRVLSDNDDNTSFFSFFCIPYVNAMPQPTIIWQTNEEYPEFTLIEVPISNPEIDSIYIEIVSGAVNGADDGCYTRTEAWVDGLGIEASTTSIPVTENNPIAIYPNPTSGKLTIKQDQNEYHHFCIFNVLGQEVERGELVGSEIEIEEDGIYYIHLISNFSKSRNITKKVIVHNN